MADTHGNPAALALSEVGFDYGARPVLRGIDFSLEKGTFFTLLGPSGCGKTTLLQVIGGYLPLKRGGVRADGVDISRLAPEKRDMGMVFQNYALFPHLSVRGNVSFPLEMRGTPRVERNRKVESILDLVGLEAALRDRLPARLSGGQQQRVALARALVFQPRVLLLDEPLANLDRNLRRQFRAELRSLQKQTGVTTVMVTHDQEEAMALSDTMAVMESGRLLQMGDPRHLYEKPRTRFLAGFLGEANILTKDLAPPAGRKASTKSYLVRPENVLVGEEARRGPICYGGQLESITYQGSDSLLEWRIEGKIVIKSLHRGPSPWARGQMAWIGWSEEALWPLEDDPLEEPLEKGQGEPG